MRIYIFLFLFAFVIACNNKKEIQKPVIPENRFISLLVDYHLAQGISNSSFVRQKLRDYKEIAFTDSIIKQHGYTRAIFDNTVLYYSKYPDKFDALYDKVITALSRMQAELQEKQAKKKNSKKPVKK